MQRVLFVWVCVFLAVPCGARIIYVDADANGANDGSSWANAYNHLQDALADANSHPDVNEIRVGQGIYKPDQNSVDPNGNGDRTATFQLVDSVALRGGYGGLGAPEPNIRDIELYETILSGDLGENDVDIAEPCDLLFDPTRGENSYHVVTAVGINNTSVLDGFTITAGNANHEGASPHYIGGGMSNSDSSPTVKHCTFKRNSARFSGAIDNIYANPEIICCIFSGNSAGSGGAMGNWHSSPMIIKCTFSDNTALALGGGIENFPDSNPTIISCTFSGNSASMFGGGIFNYVNSSPIVTNCTFSGNSADESGGGIYNEWYSDPSITNCIFWGNTAPISPEIYTDGTTSLQVSYSDIQGGWPGLGNIDVDPCFVEPGKWVDVNEPNIVVEPNDPNAVWVDGDYHLKSEGWRLDMNFDPPRWTYDYVTSRCIDAGNPGSPLRNELLTIPGDPGHIWGENLRINMGAYGGTPQASMPPYDWALLGDITNDGIVNGRDFAHQAEGWLINGAEQPGDLNRNGVVDTNDVGLFVADWLETTSWYE